MVRKIGLGWSRLSAGGDEVRQGLEKGKGAAAAHMIQKKKLSCTATHTAHHSTERSPRSKLGVARHQGWTRRVRPERQSELNPFSRPFQSFSLHSPGDYSLITPLAERTRYLRNG